MGRVLDLLILAAVCAALAFVFFVLLGELNALLDGRWAGMH